MGEEGRVGVDRVVDGRWWGIFVLELDEWVVEGEGRDESVWGVGGKEEVGDGV